MDEDVPDTLKTCEACGGDWQDGCQWCTRGFMGAVQAFRWRIFRTRMRSLSGTYSMFKDMVEDVVDRLLADNTAEGVRLAQSGMASLVAWMGAETDSAERNVASAEVAEFHRRAMDYLSSRR
jgi:hypothetical protein